MSTDASVDLEWAGDLRKFRLPIAQLVALEDACDMGCGEILGSLALTWRIRTVKHILRLALMGGGMEGVKAARIVDENVVEGRLMEAVVMAKAVLTTALVGRPDDRVGKRKVARNRREGRDSLSPPSSGTAP